jgi:hypothetical protein
VDETGLKMSYSSGNQKLLAVKCSKRIHSTTHGEKAETVTVLFCMIASGSNLILPAILCKGECWNMLLVLIPLKSIFVNFNLNKTTSV